MENLLGLLFMMFFCCDGFEICDFYIFFCNKYKNISGIKLFFFSMGFFVKMVIVLVYLLLFGKLINLILVLRLKYGDDVRYN